MNCAQFNKSQLNFITFTIIFYCLTSTKKAYICNVKLTLHDCAKHNSSFTINFSHPPQNEASPTLPIRLADHSRRRPRLDSCGILEHGELLRHLARHTQERLRISTRRLLPLDSKTVLRQTKQPLQNHRRDGESYRNRTR